MNLKFSFEKTDLASGLPIAGAVIQFMEFSEEIETDTDGNFIYDELEPGDYSLSCYAKGYQVPEPIVFTLKANESVVLDFKLTASTADGK
ncbi:MAG: carboxypeptidase-like regulatory domain-containing protein [Ignavibacteria bacterium]|nr:carboxypeptidase-like regulatory domain-containing protein [Ignavibacteria bacterium]